ncbi:Glycosyltransferase involved in cell wall bisynthesis [Algoriphagus locisalis]|uniref:Glycosyltransferase involved in cell wall bisynthesis n=1 Tax=Algoriphagus locisalis TaxID=305507 RepID=A0A1I6XQI6_9BACT|nr:glycosyltransferase family 4 protein [Algoriphagus locisalis]SFT39984.1 Glycosyltransferase involved in cell wall bisynthesis [Algoriphagus locisalis]
MYPSTKSPSYGVFVSNFSESFQDGENQIVLSSLIKGRKKGIGRILSYCWFFLDVFWKSNFMKYDLIYVHYIQHSLLPLRFWWNRANRKLVLNAHGTDIMDTGRAATLLRKLNRRLIQHANLVVVPSSFFVPKLERMGVNPCTIFVSPSGGIDPMNFYHGKGSELRLVIGYLGRLDPGKGLSTLIDSFELVSKELQLKLEIIGTGSLISALQYQVENSNPSPQISFLGVLSQQEIGERLRGWDLLIFPSELPESLGLVGLEAMACGVPVIGSEQGGILTYLENGKNGFTFEAGNTVQLADAIFDFYQLQPAKREHMSYMALQTAEKYMKQKVISRLNEQLNCLFNA